jgi:alpha-L-fucosidase 2
MILLPDYLNKNNIFCHKESLQYKYGEVKGLVARGGFVVDIKWKNSIPQKVVIKANVKNKCIVRSVFALKVDGLTEKSMEQGGSYVLEFNAEQGKVYELSPI